MPKKVYTEKWLSKFREKQGRYEVVKLKPGSMSKYAGDKMILRTAQIAEQQKAPEDQKEKQKIQKTGKMEMWGTGDESRDYIYIDDLTDVIYLAATVSNPDTYVWNVASGKEVYIKDIAVKYAEAISISKDRISFNGIIREGDPLNWCADITELKKYGFEPKTDIETGIKNYVDWITNI